jgi:hypothetical protein
MGLLFSTSGLLMQQAMMVFYSSRHVYRQSGSPGIAVIVTPAVALLASGSATAARTGGSSRQIPMNRQSSIAPGYTS